jgi:hypothetical protein
MKNTIMWGSGNWEPPAELAKLNLINKTQVLIITAARFNRHGRVTSGRPGHTPTLGCIRIRLNMIHGPMGHNKVSQHHWQKRSLH